MKEQISNDFNKEWFEGGFVLKCNNCEQNVAAFNNYEDINKILNTEIKHRKICIKKDIDEESI